MWTERHIENKENNSEQVAKIKNEFAFARQKNMSTSRKVCRITVNSEGMLSLTLRKDE